MYRERPDIAARKLERLHGKAIGGNHDLAVAEVDWHGIRLHVELARRQRRGEHVLDQFPHEAATVTVGQGDAIVENLEPFVFEQLRYLFREDAILKHAAAEPDLRNTASLPGRQGLIANGAGHARMKNLRAPGRVDARIPQHRQQRLPVAPQDAIFSRNQRQAKRLGFLAAQRLEHHGSLRFEARHRHLADERSCGVKQAARRARFGAIDAP